MQNIEGKPITIGEKLLTSAFHRLKMGFKKILRFLRGINIRENDCKAFK